MSQYPVAADTLLAYVKSRLRAGAPASATTVIWSEADAQVAVFVDRTQLWLARGWLLVNVVLSIAELGTATPTLHVVFFLGRPGEAAGSSAATTISPGAPELLVERWGRRVQIAVWNGVLDALERTAATTSRSEGRKLAVRGFTAQEGTMQVELEG